MITNQALYQLSYSSTGAHYKAPPRRRQRGVSGS